MKKYIQIERRSLDERLEDIIAYFIRERDEAAHAGNLRLVGVYTSYIMTLKECKNEIRIL